MFRAVVTDLDHTLYDWTAFVVPAVEAMVASLVETTGVPEPAVVASLRDVYERHSSNEYPFVVQEAACFTARREADPVAFEREVVRPAFEAFKAARRIHLVPFAGVLETLDALAARGIPVVALTDAPQNPAMGRVRSLGLDQGGRLRALYSLPAFAMPGHIDPAIAARDAAGGYRPAIPAHALPADHEKPDPRGLSLILERELGLPPGEVLYVGDSLHKDVALAQGLGCIDAWAEYGCRKDEALIARLRRISAPSATRRHASHEGRPEVRPTHALGAFSGLLDLLGR